ncbi:helix-turn-helix domain-containing protein [Mycobacterium helveticum]|uniref:helix-turn-helix domain-containing protein n=1 Tax=Mycobacterium helveticum TaxID=2592811 RepID=UPI001FEFF99A|nr:helix-turn-helix domain-containing protein [Mycobacterium helveticum]
MSQIRGGPGAPARATSTTTIADTEFTRQNTEPLRDLRKYLDACLADTAGMLHIAVGCGGHYDDNGKYRHTQWTESHFAWPGEAELAEREILRAAPEADVYLCPNLMVADKRAKGAAAARRHVKADIDGPFDLDKVRQLGGFAVASGTPGHAHVYVALAQSVPGHHYTALCRGLGAYLGNADSKVSDNDVLRAPGTLNHKPAARGLKPAATHFLIDPPAARVDPQTLAQMLGVTLPATAAPPASSAPGGVEVVDLAPYPGVQTALDTNTGDRSQDTYRIVGACHDAGLTLAQTRWAVGTRADLTERLDNRHDDDIQICWLKLVDAGRRQVEHSPRPAAAPTISLEDSHAVLRRWLGENYDTDALDAMLAVAAIEKFTDAGDLVWLLLVSGPGNAKTETVQALDGVGAVVTSSIASEGALLSATPKRERAKTATGGLLRKLGDRGVLVIKDVTSILSMNRDIRARVLAALREVYDGRWYREVGTDGGQTIPWQGRVAVIGAVTTAWDTAHAVVSTMGDRFVLVRLDSTTNRQEAGRSAIRHTGNEQQMRAELARAVAGVLAGISKPTEITPEETDALLAAADLVTLARTGVEYDYRGDVIDARAPEMPTRFAKQLAQILRGAVALGMDRAGALRLAIRCARDSMPPLRLAIIDDLAANPQSSTSDVRKRVDKPRNTVDRQLQALHLLGVLTVDEVAEGQAFDKRTRWLYSLAAEIDSSSINPQKVCPEMSPHLSRLSEKRIGPSRPCTDFSGPNSELSPPAAAYPLCTDCGEPLLAPASIARGRCERCHLKSRRA